MKHFVIAILLTFSATHANAGDIEKPPPIPQEGFVPTEETAVSIAEAVWIPIYGREKIESERPFKATLEGDTWTVTGTVHASHGGAAIAEISKHDGRVIYVWHEK